MSEDHVPVTDSGEKRSWKWSSLKWGSWLSDWLREAFLFLFQSRIIEPSTWFTQRRRPFQADEMWGCIFQTDLSLSQMHLLSKSFWEESQVPLPSSSVDESLTLFPCLHSCLRWCPSFLTAAIFSSTFPKNKERRCCVKRADFWSLPSCIFVSCIFSHRIEVEGPDNVLKSISAFNSLCLLFNEWPKDRLMVCAREYITYIQETCRLPLSSTSSGCCCSSFIALFPLNAKKATLSKEA